MKDDRTHAIAARAYELWERSGRPSGKHDEHWAQAELEILGKATRGGASGDQGDPAPGREGAAKPDHADEPR